MKSIMGWYTQNKQGSIPPNVEVVELDVRDGNAQIRSKNSFKTIKNMGNENRVNGYQGQIYQCNFLKAVYLLLLILTAYTQMAKISGLQLETNRKIH